MNTPPNANFVLKAQFLGPVFSLNEELSKRAQHLIFARNGIGKSFLSRAFRYLDLHGQGREIDTAARSLVSDESHGGKGAFSFSRGANTMGDLRLNVTKEETSAQTSDAIFHVFCDEFVQEELRERQYEIDGEIENQIAVDSENIKIEDAQRALERARDEAKSAANKLLGKFNNEKVVELNEKAGIYKQLKEYKTLDFETHVMSFQSKPEKPVQSFSDILIGLDRLKALPSDPRYPEEVTSILSQDIDLAALDLCLNRETSPASVSNEIREKIEKHHAFIKAGTIIFQEEEQATCPYCEQDISPPGPQATIQSYISYFADEEERHKTKLREFLEVFDNKKAAVENVQQNMVRQKARYDELKRFVPSMHDSEMISCEKEIEEVREAISEFKTVIAQKIDNLSIAYASPENDLVHRIAKVNSTIEINNEKSNNLIIAVNKSDDERKSLQRKACSIFSQEFAIHHWGDIERISNLRSAERSTERDLAELESASPSTEGRVRVAETFDLLIREFFSGKYVFDKERFILKRGDQEMIRGPHRTLSDGEKTAIAFCYFVACVHRKVQTNSDYAKLFLVFDDPVTSMSYDYVFAIAQTLKNLSISRQGEVSTNPGLIDGNKRFRPNLLILTHSSYFFNISLTNGVVDPTATFSLNAGSERHSLTRLTEYVAPFHHQLKEIYEIAKGKDPDHATGNAIRSVLEAVGRFCRPDKCQNLSDFVRFLASETDIGIKSILINSLSHGSYYEEVPPADDLRLASQETIRVVEKYAFGQLQIVRG